MLIELLSMSNYGHYNVKIAQLIGLEAAVYLSQLLDINEKAIRKEKTDNEHFILDREYITSRTTISEKDQLNIDKTLIKLGILSVAEDNANMLQVNLAALTSILMEPDKQLTQAIKRVATASTRNAQKQAKTEAMITKLKEKVITTNPDLRKAYFTWIDAVHEHGGFMTQQGVISGQAELDKFTDRNLDMALKILEIAAVNGYRDIMWAINNYKTNYSVMYAVKPTIELPRAQPEEQQVRVRKRADTQVF